MINLTQRKTKWLARLTLAAVLFAHGVLAAHACVLPSVNPTHAFAEHKVAEKPCHEGKEVAAVKVEHMPTEQMNGNACLMSCTQSDQISVDHQTPTVAPVSTAQWLPVKLQTQQQATIFIPHYQALNTGPPVAIRFCSFLI